MAIPIKVIRGKTAVIRATLDVVDSYNRKQVLKDVVPSKIPNTDVLTQTEYNLTATTATVTIGLIKNFCVFRSQESFKIKIGETTVVTKFIQFSGSSPSVSLARNLVDTRVTCIYS